MRDPVLAARNMQLLQVSGVRFAIDDFGTGYSSLSHLSRLPFDELKIDRSLIAHAHERKDDATIVASTIELAHSMNLGWLPRASRTQTAGTCCDVSVAIWRRATS